MAIDPETTITVKVGELGSAPFNSTDLVPHEVGGFLKKGNLYDLAQYVKSIIDAEGAIGFRAVQVLDGETLPATSEQEFILVGPGTYPNVGGGATVTTTGSLNALVSNGTFWFIGVEIPIDVNGIWGEITGVISDQTDLYNILEAKADLVEGKVPNSQLPSYVDDVIEVDNFAALPAVGETGKIYTTLDRGFIYRWSGSAYIRISNEAASWGTIVGTLSNQTDLQTALNTKALKTTAINTTAPLSGGGDLSGDRTLSIAQSNGSTNGFLSSTDWNTFNGKQNALSGTGFVKISGTTISYDNSTYALDSVVVKLTGNQSITGTKTFSVSTATDAILVNNTNGRGLRILNETGSVFGLIINNSLTATATPFAIQKSGSTVFSISDAGLAFASNGTLIGGTGTTNYIPKFTGANTLGNSLIFDNGTNIGIGTTSPNYSAAGRTTVDINGSSQSMLALSVGGVGKGFLFHTGTDLLVSNESNGAIKLNTNGSQKVVIESGGNVGIGTSSPLSLFNVQGSGYFPSKLITLSGAEPTRYNANIGLNIVGGSTIAMSFGTRNNNVDYDNTLNIINGNVGISTTSDVAGGVTVRTHISGTDFGLGISVSASGSQQNIRFVNGTTAVGSVTTTSSLTSYNVTSDYRLKQDFKTFNGLDLVSKIKVYDYEWKIDKSRMNGVVAHELQEVIPYAVTGEKDGKEMQSVDYSKLVPILVQAIQELKAEIEILKNK